MNKSWIICKRFTFEAKHRLFYLNKSDEENKEIFGKCFNDHGHSYKVYIYLKSYILKDGMIKNFTEIKEIFKKYTEPEFDHNKPIEEIINMLSTAENIAQFIFNKFKEYIPETYKVRIYETETSYAEYGEEE